MDAVSHPSPTCPMCKASPETLAHVLGSCLSEDTHGMVREPYGTSVHTVALAMCKRTFANIYSRAEGYLNECTQSTFHSSHSQRQTALHA